MRNAIEHIGIFTARAHNQVPLMSSLQREMLCSGRLAGQNLFEIQVAGLVIRGINVGQIIGQYRSALTANLQCGFMNTQGVGKGDRHSISALEAWTLCAIIKARAMPRDWTICISLFLKGFNQLEIKQEAAKGAEGKESGKHLPLSLFGDSPIKNTRFTAHHFKEVAATGKTFR